MTGNTQIILALVRRIRDAKRNKHKIRGEAVDGIIESLGGIALVPGLDFLIVARAFALFFDGQGIKFSFFPQVELTVQMAAAVDLRARGPGLCRCLPTSRDVS